MEGGGREGGAEKSWISASRKLLFCQENVNQCDSSGLIEPFFWAGCTFISGTGKISSAAMERQRDGEVQESGTGFRHKKLNCCCVMQRLVNLPAEDS